MPKNYRDPAASLSVARRRSWGERSATTTGASESDSGRVQDPCSRHPPSDVKANLPPATASPRPGLVLDLRVQSTWRTWESVRTMSRQARRESCRARPQFGLPQQCWEFRQREEILVNGRDSLRGRHAVLIDAERSRRPPALRGLSSISPRPRAKPPFVPGGEGTRRRCRAVSWRGKNGRPAFRSAGHSRLRPSDRRPS